MLSYWISSNAVIKPNSLHFYSVIECTRSIVCFKKKNKKKLSLCGWWTSPGNCIETRVSCCICCRKQRPEFLKYTKSYFILWIILNHFQRLTCSSRNEMPSCYFRQEQLGWLCFKFLLHFMYFCCQVFYLSPYTQADVFKFELQWMRFSYQGRSVVWLSFLIASVMMVSSCWSATHHWERKF